MTTSSESPSGEGMSGRFAAARLAAVVLACCLVAAAGSLWARSATPHRGWVPGGATQVGAPAARQEAPAPAPAPGGPMGAGQVRFVADSDARSSQAALLPAEARVIDAFFPLPRGVSARQVAAKWSWNGKLRGSLPVEETRGRGGEAAGGHVRLAAGGAAPLGPGVGEVEVSVGGKTVTRGSFVTAVAGAEICAATAPSLSLPRITALVTAAAVNLQRRTYVPAVRFRGDQRVWVIFRYAGADAGTGLVVDWTVNGMPLRPARTTVTCDQPTDLGLAWLGAKKGGGLPAGSYRVVVAFAGLGTELGHGDFSVTQGPPPVPVPRRGPAPPAPVPSPQRRQ